MSMTIDEADEEEQLVGGPQVLQPQQSKRGTTRKRPLYRQSSMDFLPSKDKTSGSLSRYVVLHVTDVQESTDSLTQPLIPPPTHRPCDPFLSSIFPTGLPLSLSISMH
jgi:hypothetical protein